MKLYYTTYIGPDHDTIMLAVVIMASARTAPRFYSRPPLGGRIFTLVRVNFTAATWPDIIDPTHNTWMRSAVASFPEDLIPIE